MVGGANAFQLSAQKLLGTACTTAQRRAARPPGHRTGRHYPDPKFCPRDKNRTTTQRDRGNKTRWFLPEQALAGNQSLPPEGWDAGAPRLSPAALLTSPYALHSTSGAPSAHCSLPPAPSVPRLLTRAGGSQELSSAGHSVPNPCSCSRFGSGLSAVG